MYANFSREVVSHVVELYGDCWQKQLRGDLFADLLFTQDGRYAEKPGRVAQGSKEIADYWQSQIVEREKAIKFVYIKSRDIVDLEKKTASVMWAATFNCRNGNKWKEVSFIQTAQLKFRFERDQWRICDLLEILHHVSNREEMKEFCGSWIK